MSDEMDDLLTWRGTLKRDLQAINRKIKKIEKREEIARIKAAALEEAVKAIKGKWFKVTSVEKEFLLGIKAAVNAVKDLGAVD